MGLRRINTEEVATQKLEAANVEKSRIEEKIQNVKATIKDAEATPSYGFLGENILPSLREQLEVLESDLLKIDNKISDHVSDIKYQQSLKTSSKRDIGEHSVYIPELDDTNASITSPTNVKGIN